MFFKIFYLLKHLTFSSFAWMYCEIKKKKTQKKQKFKTSSVPATGCPPINTSVWVNFSSCPYDSQLLRILVALTKAINNTTS